MNRDEARLALTNAILALQATYPGGIPVELPNQKEVSPTERTPYLRVVIRYQGGEQASLGRTVKHHRSYGHLLLEACVGAGTGTKVANDILQHFVPTLHMSDAHGGVRTMGAMPVGEVERDGWHVSPVIIPFWFDELN